jgi:hypothetical protein
MHQKQSADEQSRIQIKNWQHHSFSLKNGGAASATAN